MKVIKFNISIEYDNKSNSTDEFVEACIKNLIYSHLIKYDYIRRIEVTNNKK